MTVTIIFPRKTRSRVGKKKKKTVQGGGGGVGSRLIPVQRAFVSSTRAENNALDLRQAGDVSGKIEQGGLRSDHMS